MRPVFQVSQSMIGFQQFYYSKKNKRTNGQTNKRKSKRTNRQRTNEQTKERTNGQTNKRKNEGTNKLTNKRKNEQTDKRTNERTKERPTLTLTLMSSTFLSLQKKVKTFSNLFSFQVVSDSPLFFFSIYPFDESISVSFIVTP
jgi:hypothetical protein